MRRNGRWPAPARRVRARCSSRSRNLIDAIALDARHGRLAGGIACGEIVDHLFAEAILIVEHIMRNADPLGDIARIMDVLAGAAGALAMGGRAMIVELQGDADDVVAFRLQQRGGDRGIRRRRTSQRRPWCPAAGLQDPDCCAWLRSTAAVVGLPSTRYRGSGSLVPGTPVRLPCARVRRGSSFGRRETAARPAFNIGRIPERQSGPSPFARSQTANLAGRQKKRSLGARPSPSFNRINLLILLVFF